MLCPSSQSYTKRPVDLDKNVFLLKAAYINVAKLSNHFVGTNSECSYKINQNNLGAFSVIKLVSAK